MHILQTIHKYHDHAGEKERCVLVGCEGLWLRSSHGQEKAFIHTQEDKAL